MKIARFLILTIAGVAVFSLTMTFAPIMPMWAHIASFGGLLLLTGLLWLFARGALAEYRPVFFAFFAAVAGLTLAAFCTDPLLGLLHLSANTPMGSSIAKLINATLTVVGIIVVAKLAGQSMGSLFIQKGRLWLGLAIGLLGFAVFVGLTFGPNGPFFKAAATDGGLTKILPIVPWVLVFVLSNAFMEELLFRGLLLGRYEKLMGPWLALFATTIGFALAHVQVNYTAQVAGFVAFVFVLGLIWGVLMQKTKSIWGSVLFHAGADVAVILPIYQQMAGS
jgi:membrane protease YdiL (CAAX protease family)